MSTFIPRHVGVLALAAVAATGCQPGSETSGIDGTGVRAPVAAAAYGRTTAGSGFLVNGVSYDTTSMTVTIDGVPGRVSDIANGDVVLVTGTLDSTWASRGVAQSAVLEHPVVGPVDSVDTAEGSIVALGQTVRFADAVYDLSIPGASIDGIAVGDIVEVSGFRDAQSDVIATRIAKRAPGTPGFRATGRVVSLDVAAKRLEVNALTVDYATATVALGPAMNLQPGDFVEVAGTRIGADNILVADRIAFKPTDITANAGAYVNLEGYVTALDRTDPLNFEVAGLPIETTIATTKDGALVYNTRAEVKGALATNGTLVASDVRTGIPVQKGGHTIRGLVFDATRGPVAGEPLNVDVQNPKGQPAGTGYSWWWVSGRGFYTDTAGRFEVTGLPDADILLWIGSRQYMQPCAVTVDTNVETTGDVTRDIEVVALETLNSPEPPLPVTAREPTLTGTIYEVTPAGRQPVAGAGIAVDGLSGLGLPRASTVTDLSGRYFLCDLPEGMTLQVFKDGYVDKEISPVGGPASATIDVEIERL